MKVLSGTVQASFRFQGEAYWGNQELWEEHLDPEPKGILTRLLQAIRSTFRGGEARYADFRRTHSKGRNNSSITLEERYPP